MSTPDHIELRIPEPCDGEVHLLGVARCRRCGWTHSEELWEVGELAGPEDTPSPSSRLEAAIREHVEAGCA